MEAAPLGETSQPFWTADNIKMQICVTFLELWLFFCKRLQWKLQNQKQNHHSIVSKQQQPQKKTSFPLPFAVVEEQQFLLLWFLGAAATSRQTCWRIHGNKTNQTASAAGCQGGRAAAAGNVSNTFNSSKRMRQNIIKKKQKHLPGSTQH